MNPVVNCFKFSVLSSLLATIILISPNSIYAEELTSLCLADKKYVTDADYSGYTHKSKGLYSYLQPNIADNQPFEMHIVASYEGVREIEIKRSQKPIILVLASVTASNWIISSEEGARLEHIYLSGTHKQGVTGNFGESDITYCKWGVSFVWKNKNWNSKMVPSKYESFISKVREGTGLMESTFQGAHKLKDAVRVPLQKEEFEKMPSISNDTRRSSQVSKKEALFAYKRASENLPKSAKELFELLLKLMKQDKLPFLFVRGYDTGKLRSEPKMRPMALGKLSINGWKPARMKPSRRVAECDKRVSGFSDPLEVYLGSQKEDFIKCRLGKQLYILGGGNDTLLDLGGVSSDDIIDGGQGDDYLKVGAGADIVVFNKNWGSDSVSKSCRDSKTKHVELTEHVTSWPYKYKNFIVFGKGIHPEKFEWNRHKLVYDNSKNHISFNSKNPCFNFVFYEDGIFAPTIKYQKRKYTRSGYPIRTEYKY